MQVRELQIGEILAQYRLTRGLSKSAMARAAGIAVTSYTYETPNNNGIYPVPNAEIIRRLAKSLNVSADYLLGLTVNSKPTWKDAPTDEDVKKSKVAAKAVEIDKLKKQTVELSNSLSVIMAKLNTLTSQLNEL